MESEMGRERIKNRSSVIGIMGRGTLTEVEEDMEDAPLLNEDRRSIVEALVHWHSQERYVNIN